MKKALVLLCMLAIVLSGATVFAGSIDYLSNQSARYLMTFSRNAATDAADIVNYNPAGTAFLAPGLWIDFSTQTLFKPYSQTCDQTYTYTALGYTNPSAEFEQDQMTPVLPNLYAVYNFGQIGAGNLAINFQAGIVAGGGTLKWDDGTAGTVMALHGIAAKAFSLGTTAGKITSQSLEVSSVYYGLALGASYSFLDNMVAVNLGGRLVMPKKSLKLEAAYQAGQTIEGEYEFDATGYTPIIGICVKPITGLTIGLRYEFETELEFEYSQETFASNNTTIGTVAAGVLKNSGIQDGKKFNQNLPAMLAAGVEYIAMPGLTVAAQGIYYFMSSADLGKTYDSTTGAVLCDTNEFYDNGWEFSVGATYQVMPELKVGLGFNYTSQSAKSELWNEGNALLTTSANPPLNSMTFGLGGTYTIANLGLDITLTGSWTHYMSEDYNVYNSTTMARVTGTYEKDVYNIGFGIGYHL